MGPNQSFIPTAVYHDYYNLIHADYDYDLDVKILDNYCKAQNISYSHLLEVGCGTGKHTALLSHYFQRVFAIDIDPLMVRKAKQYTSEIGIQNISFLNTSASQLQGIDFCDVACAFFNVVNYLLDFDALVNFFSSISAFLKPSGVCLFDSLDASKQYEEKTVRFFTYKAGHKTLARSVESLYEPNNHLLHVTETYSGLSSDVHRQTYKLWSLQQIQRAIQNTDLNLSFHEKKINLDSSYRKKNQVIYFMKKGQKN